MGGGEAPRGTSLVVVVGSWCVCVLVFVCPFVRQRIPPPSLGVVWRRSLLICRNHKNNFFVLCFRVKGAGIRD